MLTLRSRFAYLALVGLVGSLAFGGMQSPAHALPAWCLPVGVIDLAQAPLTISQDECDLQRRIVTLNGLSLAVPQPGLGSGGWAAYPDAPERSLVLNVDPDGLVHVNSPGAAASTSVPFDVSVTGSAPISAGDDTFNGSAPDILDPTVTSGSNSASPSKCNDTARSLHPGNPRWGNGSPLFSYNPTNQPSGRTTAQYRTAILAAEVNLTRGDNTCGWSIDPNGYARLSATAGTRAPRVYANSTDCPSGDSTNDIGWVNAPTQSWAAITCVSYYTATSQMKSTDIGINRTKSFWVANGFTGCSERLDLEALMTHEFGHAWGLDHVSEPTMATWS